MVLTPGCYVMLRNPDADADPFVAQVTKLVECVTAVLTFFALLFSLMALAVVSSGLNIRR
jgi:hypothetical protein